VFQVVASRTVAFAFAFLFLQQSNYSNSTALPCNLVSTSTSIRREAVMVYSPRPRMTQILYTTIPIVVKPQPYLDMILEHNLSPTPTDSPWTTPTAHLLRHAFATDQNPILRAIGRGVRVSTTPIGSRGIKLAPIISFTGDFFDLHVHFQGQGS
jgi:hypothetical protein